jgi:hypothetical protein
MSKLPQHTEIQDLGWVKSGSRSATLVNFVCIIVFLGCDGTVPTKGLLN